MSDHEIETLTIQIDSLRDQMNAIKKALWAIVFVFLMPGAIGLITIGTQMNRLETTEETAASNMEGLRTQERIAARQAAQLESIAQSISRVERLLEQLAKEERQR